MTDQIYYKVQYPVKKAINSIKKIDPENPFAGKNTYNQSDIQKIKMFLDTWDNEGEEKLKDLIKRLRKNK